MCEKSANNAVFSHNDGTGLNLKYIFKISFEVEDLANLSLNKPVRLFISETMETALNLQQEFIKIRQDRENHREAYVACMLKLQKIFN